jgi:hypothetical protein
VIRAEFGAGGRDPPGGPLLPAHHQPDAFDRPQD